MAQPAQPAAPSGRTEEIVVTGTRIPRKDLTTPAPVTVIGRSQFEDSGKVSIGDFLQSLPEQGNAINTTVNNGGDGSTRVNLRGLGDPRTLVLLNGRRIVGVGTPQFTEATVDLNSIPSSAIERIEILKDGASALYGSDAVGGVINLITRKSFSGTELSAYGGRAKPGDGDTYELNLTGGTSSERAHMLFSVGYLDTAPVYAGDRSHSASQLFLDYTTGEVTRSGSSAIPSGRFSVPVRRDAAGNITGCLPGGTGLYRTLCSETVTSGNPAWVPDPFAPNGYHQYAGSADAYNFQPLNYDLTPQRRISLFSTGDIALAGSARAYFEASYVNRQSNQQFAPEPLFSNNLAVPVTLSASSLYNPLGLDVTDVRRRLVEFGPRRQIQDLTTFRTVTGLNGTLPEELGPLHGWSWDTSFNFGRTQGVQSFTGALRSSRIASALGPSMIDPTSGQPICVTTPGDAGTAIPGCVPINLLHVSTPNNPSGTIDAAQIAGLGYTGTTRTFLQMAAVQVNTSGELFRLLSERPLGLAVGYEYRRESGGNIPDPVAAASDSTDLNFSETSGSFFVNEGYAELSVPIVENLPYISNLEASAATRVSDYSTFGTHGTYKFGGRWSIVRDVTLRGTYSTAFRAPSISELFLGQTDNFPTAADPCAGISPVTGEAVPISPTVVAQCTAQGALNNGDTSIQLKTRNGGNSALDPETAKIFTAGVVLEPRYVKNFSVTVDYFNFAIDNSIATRGAGVILNGCLTGSRPELCALIHRDPTTHFVTFIDDLNTNVGNDRVDGIDLAARYALPTMVGRFGFAFDGTWLHKFDRTLADGTLVKGKGTYDLAINTGGIGGVYPSYKFNTGVTWGLGDVGAGITTRYIGSFRECADITGGSSSAGACYLFPDLSHHVSYYNSWDAFISYRLRTAAGKTSIAAGARNVFDTKPPVIYNSFTPTSDATAYDLIGRTFYLRLTHAI